MRFKSSLYNLILIPLYNYITVAVSAEWVNLQDSKLIHYGFALTWTIPPQEWTGQTSKHETLENKVNENCFHQKSIYPN